jgi:hypothetical protein
MYLLSSRLAHCFFCCPTETIPNATLIYDFCLFAILSPMIWLPIYQVCEFAYHRRTEGASKVHPFEGDRSGRGDEEEGRRELPYLTEGRGDGGGVEVQEEVKVTHLNRSAEADFVKLTLSDKFLSEELKRRSNSLEGGVQEVDEEEAGEGDVGEGIEKEGDEDSEVAFVRFDVVNKGGDCDEVEAV